MGLDGFVDKIVTPVDKRHGMGEQFDAIETIADLGSESQLLLEKCKPGTFPTLKN